MLFTQTEVRRHVPRRLPIPTSVTRASQESAERFRRILADRNRFISWASKFVSYIPRTVVVDKGVVSPDLYLEYPVVVKPAKGKGCVRCDTRSDLLKASRQMKGSYQVQEHLQNFTFLRLSCQNGLIEMRNKQTSNKLLSGSDDYAVVLHASRRLIETITSLGVKSFTLTVAVKGQTVYITSCRPDSGQMK